MVNFTRFAIPTEVNQNLANAQLFPPKWLRMTQNFGQSGSVDLILIRNFSNLFPPKWLRMTRNGQFAPDLICNFSQNLFPPPKWLRMTWNGQFHPICNLQLFHESGLEANLFNFSTFSTKVAQNDSEFGPVSYQFQNDQNGLPDSTFPIYSHRSGSESHAMANVARLSTFPIYSHRSGSE